MFVRILLVTVAVLAAADLRANETIKVSIARTKAFVGSMSSLEVYINETSVATLGNGTTKNLTFHGGKIGKNSVRIVQHTIFGTYPFWQNTLAKSGDKKFFLIRSSGETVTMKIGCNDNDVLNQIFQVSNEVAEDWDHPKVLRVALDKSLKAKTVKESPPMRLARNTQKTVSDTLKVRHETSISKRWRASAELDANIRGMWANVDLRLRAEIEKVTNRQYGVETERTRSVTVVGGRPVKVVWVEYYRTGTATVLVRGETSEVPFEFREDFDLLTDEVP